MKIQITKPSGMKNIIEASVREGFVIMPDGKAAFTKEIVKANNLTMAQVSKKFDELDESVKVHALRLGENEDGTIIEEKKSLAEIKKEGAAERKRQNDFLRSKGYTWKKERRYDAFATSEDDMKLTWILHGPNGEKFDDINNDLLTELGYYGEEKRVELIEKRERAEKIEAARAELAEWLRETPSETPAETVNPDGIILGEFTATGGGEQFIITGDAIWHVVNNGADGADWSANNYETGGAGAIASRYPRDEKIIEALEIIYDVSIPPPNSPSDPNSRKATITKHTRLIIEWKIHGKEAAREIYKLNESETEFEITPEQFIEWRTQIQESNIELNEKGERDIEDFVKMRLFNADFRSAVQERELNPQSAEESKLSSADWAIVGDAKITKKSSNIYELKTPYNPEFVKFLKDFFPRERRWFVPGKKIWEVKVENDSEKEAIFAIIEHFWGDGRELPEKKELPAIEKKAIEKKLVSILNRSGEFVAFRFKCEYEDRHIPKAAGFIWNKVVPQAWATKDAETAAKLIEYATEKTRKRLVSSLI